MERTDGNARRSENPTNYLEPHLEDGIVMDARFVERYEPEAALHPQETMDEDDSFLSVGSEVWEYDVADSRDEDFKQAMARSQMVIEYEALEETLEPET